MATALEQDILDRLASLETQHRATRDIADRALRLGSDAMPADVANKPNGFVALDVNGKLPRHLFTRHDQVMLDADQPVRDPA